MCLVELLILENLYFATGFNKLSALGQKLQPITYFGSHLGSHLGFTDLDIPEVILMCLVDLLIYVNLYFVSNFIKLSALVQKLLAFIGFGGHLGHHLEFQENCRCDEGVPSFF